MPRKKNGNGGSHAQESPIDMSTLNAKLDGFESSFCKDFPISNTKESLYPVSSSHAVKYSEGAKNNQKKVRAHVVALRKLLATMSVQVKLVRIV